LGFNQHTAETSTLEYILQTAVKRGYYLVHPRWRDGTRRRNCQKLERQGLLTFEGKSGRQTLQYKPTEAGMALATKRKQALTLLREMAKDIDWQSGFIVVRDKDAKRLKRLQKVIEDEDS
jgi:DNA-binding PadR family transcriptional regulator